MKILFHGAAREVGKSCFELVSEGKRYLMDAGVKFVQGGVEYPKYLDAIYDVSGIFLSHAHMDHSGALPMLEHKQLNCPIYTTQLTWQITNILLKDSYHLEKLKHLHPAYLERDIHKVQKDVRFINYDEEYSTADKKIKFQYINAGHIPGSACILLELEGKKLLYTGDINTEDSLLMVGSNAHQLQDIDILICENTYGERMHPERKDTDEHFMSSVKEGLERGGSILIPVFSVGRAQEVIMLLQKMDIDAPIYLDGMGRQVTKIVSEHPDPYINNKDLLEKSMRDTIFIEHPKERDQIVRRKGIVIVSSSGMLQGGPSVSYAEHLIGDPKNMVLLTGFQASGTRGRSLFEDHLFYNNHQRHKVKATVRKYDFSAHYGQDRIQELIKKVNPKHLILVHGDLEAVETSKRYAEETIEGKVWVPYIGEEINLD
jgi:putative mRNA 3-end processing factor